MPSSIYSQSASSRTKSRVSVQFSIIVALRQSAFSRIWVYRFDILSYLGDAYASSPCRLIRGILTPVKDSSILSKSAQLLQCDRSKIDGEQLNNCSDQSLVKIYIYDFCSSSLLKPTIHSYFLKFRPPRLTKYRSSASEGICG